MRRSGVETLPFTITMSSKCGRFTERCKWAKRREVWQAKSMQVAALNWECPLNRNLWEILRVARIKNVELRRVASNPYHISQEHAHPRLQQGAEGERVSTACSRSLGYAGLSAGRDCGRRRNAHRLLNIFVRFTSWKEKYNIEAARASAWAKKNSPAIRRGGAAGKRRQPERRYGIVGAHTELRRGIAASSPAVHVSSLRPTHIYFFCGPGVDPQYCGDFERLRINAHK